jgi:hypothetical protein
MDRAARLTADIRDQEEMIEEWTVSLLQRRREKYRFNDRTPSYVRALNLRDIRELEAKIVGAVKYCEQMRGY